MKAKCNNKQVYEHKANQLKKQNKKKLPWIKKKEKTVCNSQFSSRSYDTGA